MPIALNRLMHDGGVQKENILNVMELNLFCDVLLKTKLKQWRSTSFVTSLHAGRNSCAASEKSLTVSGMCGCPGFFFSARIAPLGLSASVLGITGYRWPTGKNIKPGLGN
jgi:hypothetical protein